MAMPLSLRIFLWRENAGTKLVLDRTIEFLLLGIEY
jgi:hypothetical protein